MDCYNCKAKSVCAAVVQPGSVICLMNRMRYCGTHAEEEPRRQQGDSRATFASIVGIACGRSDASASATM